MMQIIDNPQDIYVSNITIYENNHFMVLISLNYEYN